MHKHNHSFLHWHHHPSAFLLAAQLLSLALYAAFDGSSSGRVLLSIFGVVLLALVVGVIDRSPALTWIAWVLVAPAIVLSLLSILFLNPQTRLGR